MSSFFDGTFGTIFYFIIALSVIVSVHEYGHYIIGRICGVHAEVFSIGFGPILFSLIDKKGTKWQAALIPLGGYVKFSEDTPNKKQFENQNIGLGLNNVNLLRRAAIIIAGPAFNFILSIIIFAAIIQHSGSISQFTIIGKLKDIPGLNGAFLPGDKIVEIESQKVEKMSEFLKVVSELEPKKFVNYTIIRNDKTLVFNNIFPFLPLVDKLQPKSAAIEAGLRVGDLITEIDGVPVYSLSTVQNLVNQSRGIPLYLKILREGKSIGVRVTPKRVDIPKNDTFESRWLIGFSGGIFFDPIRQGITVKESLWQGVKQSWDVINSSVVGLSGIISGAISSCNLQGPIGIAEVSGDIARQGIIDYIWFIGIMSTAIGLLNLFPIPVLDGGHLVFIVYEAVFNKPISSIIHKFLMVFGMILILGLMIFALSNDLLC